MGAGRTAIPAGETLDKFEVPGHGEVTAVRTPAEGDAGWAFAYAPGAGSNVHDPFGAYLARALAARGVASMRFQFPYQEIKKRSPDRPAVLEATWRAAIEAARAENEKLVVGGRSMGGRIASQVVAQGASVDALALFAYPLHAPGKHDALRDAHLPSLKLPVLFCSGTRDAFGSPDEIRTAAAKVAGSEVHVMEHADHGFSVPKTSGRTRDEVWDEAVAAMAEWLRI